MKKQLLGLMTFISISSAYAADVDTLELTSLEECVQENTNSNYPDKQSVAKACEADVTGSTYNFNPKKYLATETTKEAQEALTETPADTSF